MVWQWITTRPFLVAREGDCVTCILSSLPLSSILGTWYRQVSQEQSCSTIATAVEMDPSLQAQAQQGWLHFQGWGLHPLVVRSFLQVGAGPRLIQRPVPVRLKEAQSGTMCVVCCLLCHHNYIHIIFLLLWMITLFGITHYYNIYCNLTNGSDTIYCNTIVGSNTTIV